MLQRFLKLTLFCVLCCCLASARAAGGDRFVLVIDPGHGGKDAGAVGSFSKEKDINLKVALEFGRLVKENCPDVKVVFTRSTDVFIPLETRADIANRNKADLFISVHTNALPKGRIAYGSETYTLGMARAAENLEVAKRENSVISLETNYKQTYAGFDPNKAESYVIFELMQDKYMQQSVELARSIQRQYVGAGRKDKGVHQAGFLVLRHVSMPAVLTELGFISTPEEEAYLNSREGIAALARSIYNGFVGYRNAQNRWVTPWPVVDNKPAEPAPAPETPANPAPEQRREPTETPAVPAASKQEGGLVFKVQLFVVDRELRSNDARFKGLKGATFYRERNAWKYTYGSSESYDEMRGVLKEVQKTFPDAFVVAFRNGERIDLATAIRESRTKKQ